MPVIVVERALTKDQYIRVCLAIMVRHRLVYLLVVLPMLLALEGVILRNDLLLVLAVLAPAGGLGTWILTILYQAHNPKNRNFFEMVRLTFGDDSLAVTSNLEQGTLRWGAFVKWKRMAGCYVLFLSAMSFIAIPVSAIPPQDVPVFESLLTTKIRKM